jgi:hypothetical protein
MSRVKQVYTTTDSIEVLLALRELFSRNRVAESFNNKKLAELIYRERLLPYRVAAHDVEIALEVLRGARDEVLA